MLGAVLSITSAACFALYSACARRGVITASVFQALAFTVPLGLPLFLLVAVASGQFSAIFTFSRVNYLWLSLAGVFHFIWGRYCSTRAIKAIGSNLASPVQQTSLVISLTLAVVLLDESFTPISILGIILLFIGPAIIIAGQRQKKSSGAAVDGLTDEEAKADEKPVFEPKYLEGYTFAALTATGYGLSPIFVRLALEGTGPEVAIAAGTVSYIAATAFFALLLIPSRNFTHIAAVDRKVIPWFISSAVFVGIAQLLRYLALSLAPVTIVSPLQRTSMVFRVVFTTLINREYEVLNARVIIGIAVSLLGAVGLVLSMDMIAELIPLPPEMMEWRWP
jgi:drug/metabolite transporter (DMT)-like permease